MAETRRGHELHKYYTGQEQPSPERLEGHQNTILEHGTPEPSALYSVLVAHAEVVVLRLGVSAASVTLTDGKTAHYVARGRKRPTEALWPGGLDGEMEVWRKLSQQTARPESELGCLVIPDLSEDVRFKSLPFVVEWPSLRFYASTPIITNLGINIGDLAIVDDQPRQALSDQDRNTLTSTATNCMNQLETARDAELKRRSDRMNEALGSFIRSRATVSHAPKDPPYGQQSDNKAPLQTSSKKKEKEKAPLRSESAAFPRNETGKINESASPSRPTSTRPTDPSQETDDESGSIYKKTFRRAARHLHRALEVDGVLFADGLVGLHGDLLPGNEPVQELEHEAARAPDGYRKGGARPNGTGISTRDRDVDTNSTKVTSSDEGNLGAGQDSAKRTFTSASYQKSGETMRAAEILGYSAGATRSLAQQGRWTEDLSAFNNLTEGLLQQFLERHTKGEIFYYDTKGNSFRSLEHALVPTEDTDEDARLLYSLFPGARQLIFSPLTDVVTQKRLAGFFAWSTLPIPVLTEADLGPIKTFLYSVEAEISRVDTVAAVKQQEAFVSSVSHELRSPLHGILGAVELLSDTDINSFQQDLANTIRLCGTALHETLSSVLAYAKINEFERKQNQRRHRIARESSWALENAKAASADQEVNPRDLYVSTDVASLCEDIVEVVGTKHPLSTATTDPSKGINERMDRSTASQSMSSLREGSGPDSAPTLTLVVAYSTNWNFMTEPGAIRRVMMNIIGNALKYSPRGFVKVFLDIEHLDDIEKLADDEALPVQNVIFTVRDSGKGMSKEFLSNGLFLPFSQENAIASPGVGLGMSIVKSLVSLLGGRIDVESHVGKGTEIKVTLPMTASRSGSHGSSPTESRLEQDTIKLQHERLNVAMLDFAPIIRESLETYLTGWCSCNVLPEDDKTSDADIVVVHQGESQTFKEVRTRMGVYGSRLPTLIISSSLPSLKEAQVSSQGYMNVLRISQPFGPNKIVKALLKCVDNTAVLQEPDAQTRSPDSASTSVVSATPPIENSRALDGQVSSSDAGTGGPPSAEGAHSGASSTAASPWLERSTSGARPDTEILSLNNRQTARITHSASDTSWTTAPVSSSTADRGSKSSPRLLLVDDNAINLKLLETFMKKIGYHDIETAANGRLAVRAVENRAEGFEVIFMDISMPVMDGLEATRAIRSLEKERAAAASPTSPAPSPALVVALTGLASTHEQSEAFRSGVDSFITKPVRFESLKKLFEERESRKLQGDADGTKKSEGKEKTEN